MGLNSKVESNVQEMLSSKARHRQWMKVISALAGVVVFCTTYALILPAITMSSQQANCRCEEHKHSDECYDDKGNLICGVEEHIHTLSCYADLQDAIESEEIWRQEVPELTADRNADIVSIAGSLIGYHESDSNYLVSEGEETKGYTRFGHWYGEMIEQKLQERADKANQEPPETMEVKTAFSDELSTGKVSRIVNGLPAYAYIDWNAMFVSYVLHYAQIPEFGYETDAGNWAGALAESGHYIDAENYIPRAGDLIFFTPHAGDKVQVGIVSKVNKGMFGMGAGVSSLSVIVGDYEDAVAEIRVAVNGAGEGDEIFEKINGYGVLEPDAAAEGNSRQMSAGKDESVTGSIVDLISGIFADGSDTASIDDPESTTGEDSDETADKPGDGGDLESDETEEAAREMDEYTAWVDLDQAEIIEEDGAIVMSWRISAVLPEGVLPAGAVISVDTGTGKAHYMTADQVLEWACGENPVIFADTDCFDCTFIGSNGTLYSMEEIQQLKEDAVVRFSGVHVKVLKDVQAADDEGIMTFPYETTTYRSLANAGFNYYITKASVNGCAGTASYVYENDEPALNDQDQILKDTELWNEGENDKKEEDGEPKSDPLSIGITSKEKSGIDGKASDKGGSQTHTLRMSGSGFELTMTYGDEAGIPDGAKLKAKEIRETSGEYDRYLAKSRKALGMSRGKDELFGRFFDISIIAKNGEVEPKAPVTVNLEYTKPMETEDPSLVKTIHFGDEGAEEIKADVNAAGSEVSSIVFRTDSFSVYGIVYTVDFEYEVDGKTYAYSLDGGEEILLSELVDALAMLEGTDYRDTAEFMDAVDNVEFSDPSLIKVTKKTEKSGGFLGIGGKKENDWVLESLRSFETEESLYITMANGDLITVKVTDPPQPHGPVSVSVNKRWLKSDGTAATEDLPETLTFELWREKQEIPAVTLELYICDQERHAHSIRLIEEYAFEPGSEATVSYAYSSSYASAGRPGAYWIDDAKTELRGDELRVHPSGSFNVTVPQSGTVKVYVSYGIWGTDSLASASASGTQTSCPYEEDTGFSDQVTIGAAGNWTGSFAPHPGEENGYNYRYHVTERSLEGWKTTYSSNNTEGLTENGTVTVTNVESKFIKVTKQWKDDEGRSAAWPQDTDVSVRLQRRIGFRAWQDVPGATWVLNNQAQEHTFEVDALDQYDQVYDYRAVETAVDGYTPSVTTDADGNFIITNSPQEKLENIPVTKEWDGAETWSATFVLQWAPVYPGQSAPSADFVNWEGDPEVTVSNDAPTDTTTFSDLPKYGVDVNGDVFRYQYSLDETAYTASIGGETVTYSYNSATGTGTYTGSQKYVPVYTHDAGELSARDSDYHIDVVNTESMETVRESINVPFTKNWSNSAIETDPDAYAEFAIRRYVRQAYRDTSHLSDRDLIAEPVTVTLKDEGGTVIDTIQVQPNMGVNVQIVAQPAVNTTTSVSVVGPGLTNQRFDNDGSNHQAVTWTTDFIYPAEDTTLTIRGDTGRVTAKLYDTTPGTAAVPDTSYNESFRLDRNDLDGDKWATELDLPTEVLGAVAGRTQVVYYYEYYFEEIGNSAGSVDPGVDYYPHFVPHYNETHRISSDKTVNVNNNTVKPFFVKKKWRKSIDQDCFPEIRFTLYQGLEGPAGTDGKATVQAGSVFVGTHGERFEDIPLNADNDWTWECPISLPTNVGGDNVGYYVVESTTNADNGRAVITYTNSTFKDDGTVDTAGTRINDDSFGNNTIRIYDYNNDRNAHNAVRNDQQQPQGYKGGFVGNEGTLYIENTSPEYIQFDQKKKWLLIQDDGGLATKTSDKIVQLNTFMQLQIYRLTVAVDETIDNPISDWQPYGEPYYIGYDGTVVGGGKGTPHLSNYQFGTDTETYGNTYEGDWHWRIHENGKNTGLPEWGFYEEADGTFSRVKYYYIFREMGIYKDMNGSAWEPTGDYAGDDRYSGYTWLGELLPQAWGPDRPEVFSKIVAQDQDRVVNSPGTDLTVEKVWDDTPDNVEEVYVKIWRAKKGEVNDPTKWFDFTSAMGSYLHVFPDYGFVENPDDYKELSYSYETQSGKRVRVPDGVIVLRPENGSVTVTGLPLAAEGGNIGKDEDLFRYWIEEVGYKDKNGNVYRSSAGYDAVEQFMPRYTRWVPDVSEPDGGHWVTEWVDDPVDNVITPGKMGNNKLRVGNSPTIDITVEKQWIDGDGNPIENLSAYLQQHASTTLFKHTDSLKIRVQRIAQKYVDDEPVGPVSIDYVKFGGNTPEDEKLPLSAVGRRYQVSVIQNGGLQYDIEQEVEYTAPDYSNDQIREHAWKTIVDGLQEMAYVNNDEWHYGYNIIEEVNVPEAERWKITYEGNPVTQGNAVVAIKNEDKPPSVNLSIKKEMGGDEIPPEAYDQLFTVSVDFDGTEIPGQGKQFALEWDPAQPADGRNRPASISVARTAGTQPHERLYDAVTLQLLPDETVTIKELPKGVYYTVSEPASGMPNGYGLKEATVDVTVKSDAPNPDHNGSKSVSADGVVTVTRAESDGSIVFVNEIKFGAIRLKKLVTINGDEDPSSGTYNLVDGDYVFSIVGPDSLPVGERMTKYVQIHVANGAAATYKISDTNSFNGVSSENVDANGWALIPDLPSGDYVIAETSVPGMSVGSITGGNNNGNTATRTVTVHVTAGDDGAAQAQARATYRNDRSLVDVKIVKIDERTRDESTQTKIPNAKFTLYKYTVTGGSAGSYVPYPDAQSAEKSTSQAQGEGYGTLIYDRLPDGQYRISETEMPTGYVRTENNDFYFDIEGGVVTRYSGAYTGSPRTPQEVIGEADEVVKVTYTKAAGSNIAAFTVGNEPGDALPHTGGSGIGMIYLLGFILAGVGGMGLAMRRKGAVWR